MLQVRSFERNNLTFRHTMTIFCLHMFSECMVNGVNYNQNILYNQAGYQNPYASYGAYPLQGYYVQNPSAQYPMGQYQTQSPAGYVPETYNTTQGYYNPYQMAPALVQDTFVSQAQTQNAKIANAKTNKAKLSLFFVNDMHGHIDNMTNILGASKQFDKDVKLKGADAIKISAGDNYAGSDVKRNNLMVDFLEYIGIQASAVGNHEYDASTSTLCDTAKKSSVKFLAANVVPPQGSDFYNNVQKSIIIEQNGNQYGIVGLTPIDLETVASQSRALEGVKPNSLEETVRLAQIEIDKLRAQGVNKIILTSHLGIDKDKQIAPLLEGVDIIQGGHSHNLTPELKQGENIVASKTGEPIIIVQAGENGKYAGVLDVDFDENGIITAAALDISRAELEKSPVLESIKSEALGPSPKVGELMEVDPLPENRRTTPCAWTGFLCDAMRAELNTDIAFVNSGNTRKVPKPGIITERDISETTPMKNVLMISNMTEKEIVRVIKEAAKTSMQSKTGEPGLMQASGLTYTITSAGDLVELNFVDKQGNKTPIDVNNPSDTKFYTVAHDSFVCEEREEPEYPGMFISAHKNQEVKKFDFDKDKTLIDYIKKLPNKDGLKITDDGRIKIIPANGTANVYGGTTQA